ncbi:ribonuclease H-like domain-containing protein [Tanacetum coccineum]
MLQFFKDSLSLNFFNDPKILGDFGFIQGNLTLDNLRNQSRFGINKWYQSFSLRNFDLEDMDLESINSGPTTKLPILKLGEYEMWENGTSVTKMSIPITAEENTNKKNDVKARILLLMALPNEHQLTFSQYPDAKSMFATIETRFRGNASTKKTQKTLLKQQYENFNATSAESLNFIFNRLQKIVSRLSILGVVIAQEDLNSKFLSSLPPEWNTYVVVWMNKPEVETMSIDYLYNNFKIVKQKVKKSIGGSSGAQNMAFMTTPSTNSTNDTNTASPQVSTASPNVNAANPQVSTASVSDNTVYAFMVENPNGSNVLHQDLEQIHEDDLEAMDLKWQLSLLSVREKKYYQRTGKKIFINANDITGYDKSKVECYNYHKLGHVARECRAPRSKESQFRNQDSTRKQGNNEDKSSKAMLAIDGVGFDWSDMAEEQVQTNMALMAFSDSEVYTDKTCSKTCLKNYETLKKQCDDLLVKLNESEFKATTYKRAYKDYEINVLKSELEKVKQEKDGIDFKIEKFEKASKDLDQLLGSQITNKCKKGLGYSAVPPPHPLIYNRPNKLDLSYSGLDEFKEPEFKDNSKENSVESLVEEQVSQDKSSFVETSPNVDKETIFPVNKKSLNSKVMVPGEIVRRSNVVCNKKSDNSKENSIESLVEEQVSQDTSSFVESSPNVDKETVFPVNKKGKPQHDDKGFVDSGCSRHMTGNIAYLSDFKEFDGGYVAFRGGAYGGRITGKGTLKTDNLDFKDVYFINELKFNLFRVSHMCDKKNYVLFTDTECLVISPNFKLPDENQILLKIPRKDNMYSFDMKNIVPKESLTCLVAKATLDESMLWHRRLGHINFKNINKLVKDNLVRGLPTKHFENDQTCVACLKGKQRRTSYRLGKFDGKSDEGFFVCYSLSSKTFRVYNTRTRRVEENLHIEFFENKPMIEGNGPKWLFDIDSLTQSMNYKDTSYFDSPTKDVDNCEPKTVDDPQKQVEDSPNNENAEQERFPDDSSTKDVNAVGQQVNTASPDVTYGYTIMIIDNDSKEQRRCGKI